MTNTRFCTLLASAIVAMLLGTPILAQGAAAPPKKIYAIRTTVAAENGAAWSRAVQKTVEAHAKHDDGNVWAVNPNGTEKWRFPTGGNVESSAIVNPVANVSQEMTFQTREPSVVPKPDDKSTFDIFGLSLIGGSLAFAGYVWQKVRKLPKKEND